MSIVNKYPIKLDILDKYKLDIRGRIIQVNGLSGSGKSMLCDTISDIRSDIKYNNGKYPDYYNSLVEFDAKRDNIKVSDFASLSNHFIFIDRADDLDKSLIDYIRCDKSNIYILFARTCLGLGISPNYICEFVVDNDVICTDYKFSEKGWF